MADHVTLTVGIDGSEQSSRALAWAAREAHRRGCQLHAVHAYSVPVYGSDFGIGGGYPQVDLVELQASHEASANVQLAVARAAYPKLQIDLAVHVGSAIGAIVDNSPDTELTVIGSHGAGSVAALFLGSIAHGVVHRSSTPVVLVPNAPVASDIANIAVATDGSQAAQAAVNWAADEAEMWGAELTLIHAWDYPYSRPRAATVEPAALMELDAEHLMTAAIDELRLNRPNLAVTVQTRVVRGPVVSAIIETAKESDLLVVGARGRGALRSMVLGSTSSAAIHRASCPLAVVHAQTEEPPRH